VLIDLRLTSQLALLRHEFLRHESERGHQISVTFLSMQCHVSYFIVLGITCYLLAQTSCLKVAASLCVQGCETITLQHDLPEHIHVE